MLCFSLSTFRSSDPPSHDDCADNPGPHTTHVVLILSGVMVCLLKKSGPSRLLRHIPKCAFRYTLHTLRCHEIFNAHGRFHCSVSYPGCLCVPRFNGAITASSVVRSAAVLWVKTRRTATTDAHFAVYSHSLARRKVTGRGYICAGKCKETTRTALSPSNGIKRAHSSHLLTRYTFLQYDFPSPKRYSPLCVLGPLGRRPDSSTHTTSSLSYRIRLYREGLR